MSPAEERATHPQGDDFMDFFHGLMLYQTKSCWERDVLRATKDHLWEAWKARAAEDER